MSLKAMAWAWDQDVPGADKLMLLALADHAHDDGRCWPGQKSLAIKCSVSERSVRSTLQRLEKGDLIYREERRRQDGTRTSDLICLTYRKSAAGCDQQPEVERRDNRKSTAGHEPSEEPSAIEGVRARGPVDQVWDHWRSVFKSPTSKLVATRRRVITEALKVATVDECCRAIDGLAVSEYHVSNRYRDIKYALRGGGTAPVPEATIDRMIAMVDGPGSRGKVSGHRTDASEWDAVAAAKIKADEEQQAREAAAIRARWDAQARGGLSG